MPHNAPIFMPIPSPVVVPAKPSKQQPKHLWHQIRVAFLYFYMTSLLVLMLVFYNSLQDTCSQRAASRAALVQILISDPDMTPEMTEFTLTNLPPLRC